MPVRCESGWVFCREVAAGQCVICRRFFCARHGDVAAGHCRHCATAYARRVATEAALVTEAARQDAARVRNADGCCGWVDCAGAPTVACEHCGFFYCALHTTHYRYQYRFRSRRGVETRHGAVVLCDGCKSALPEYKRPRTWQDA